MIHSYKKIGISCLVVAGVLMAGATPAQALFNPFSKFSDEYMAGKMLDTINKYGANQFCRQGDARKGIFSARSFGGNAASISATLASLGMLACKENNLNDFDKSDFFVKAKKKLGTDDMEAIRKIFEAKVRVAKGKVLDLSLKMSCAMAGSALVASEAGIAYIPALASTCKVALGLVKKKYAPK